MAGRGGAREKVLESAYKLFYRQGYARVGVDEIANAAGVTKRTLYYHFASKDDLLAAVLEAQRPLALEQIRAWAAALPTTDPGLALERLFADLRRWAAKPGWTGSGYTRLAIELADLPGHPARKIASVHKSEAEAAYRVLLAASGMPDAPARARELIIVLEGALVQTMLHGGTDYLDAALALMKDRLGGSTPTSPHRPSTP